jgi:hypothetical protein
MQFTIAEDNRTYDITGQAGPVIEILRVLRSHGLPFGGSFDLRAYPVVREQVLEILRSNAAAQAPRPGAQQFSPAVASPNPAPAWLPPPPPAPSAAQRLQELETLRATGAITESEYAAKRQQVIASL